MGLFEDVFNKANIYEMFFFNVKSVLEYPTLNLLKEKNLSLYQSWEEISKQKNLNIISNDIFYQENAPYYPEFCKIISITFANVYNENNEFKRYFKKILNDDESTTIKNFFTVLNEISSDGVKSQPQFFPTLCGYNIINYEIPLLIKRYLKNSDNINGGLPYILKRALTIKPWESGVLDVVNVWNFNGRYDIMPLTAITKFLNLKRKTELLSPTELSKYYWDNIEIDKEKTLEYVSLQSATQTNLTIQIINTLRMI